ncbi:MAG TPA: prepilin-type N-terminal cleavage/methylation domain-containing protein [Nitrospiria bacterium]
MKLKVQNKFSGSESLLKNSFGFTLIEMMVVVVILGVSMIWIFEMVVNQQKGYLIQEEVSEAQQDIRVAMDMIAAEIRRAGADIPKGVIPLCPAAPACTNSNPDSISFSITNGFSTFLVPSGGLVVDGGATKVYVQSINGFIGGVVNILRPGSKELISSHTISAGGPLPGPPAEIPLDTPAPDSAVLRPGDMVVYPPFIVTYDLVGTSLRRNGVTLAENIQDLQFSYISSSGTETAVPPANSLDIRAVRITISSGTTKDVSQIGGAARTRQLSTIVKVRNLEL